MILFDVAFNEKKNINDINKLILRNFKNSSIKMPQEEAYNEYKMKNDEL